MHTATQLSTAMFEVRSHGEVHSIDYVVPGWDQHDRFGIVLHEALGGIGASLLIQAVVAKSFACRREAGLEDIYPEIYAFHVGARHGDHSAFDFWPPNKEILVADDAEEVLTAINDRGVTRLAVPDGLPGRTAYLWPELAAAKARVPTAWAYSPTGGVERADLTIRSLSSNTEENPKWLLDMSPLVEELRDSDDPDTRRWLETVRARTDEVRPEDRRRIAARRAATARDGAAQESYRRIELDEALGRLVP